MRSSSKSPSGPPGPPTLPRDRQVRYRFGRMRALAAMGMVAIVVGGAGAAQATPKTLVLGAGECRDGLLLRSVADFQTRARGVLGVELLEHEAAVSQLRPQPTRSLDEAKRQIEQARSLVYGAEYERALSMMKDVLTGLERTPPREEGLWATTVEALMLVAQIHKSVERIRDSNEAFRRILRVEPQYQADTNIWPPRTVRALEGVRRDLLRAKKGVLQVATLAGSGASASVFVDGREVGRTPLRVELPRGTYRLSLVSGEEVSFPREVKVDGEVLVQVDLTFEGSVRAQVPLCLPGEDVAALRLAAAVGADRLVVLRGATQAGGPSYLTGVLYEVARGERVRNAGVRHEQLKELMLYLLTGEPDISSTSPVALTAAASPSESPRAVDVTSPTSAFPWRRGGHRRSHRLRAGSSGSAGRQRERVSRGRRPGPGRAGPPSGRRGAPGGRCGARRRGRGHAALGARA